MVHAENAKKNDAKEPQSEQALYLCPRRVSLFAEAFSEGEMGILRNANQLEGCRPQSPPCETQGETLRGPQMGTLQTHVRGYFAAFFLILFTLSVGAQSPKYRVTSIPVQKNGVWMRDPWVGGMDCPQFSMADLNQDGIPDLFVFDRVGNRVLTYLGNGSANPDTMFTYAPQYESLFPGWMSNWALLRDYNHDGIPDIFTYTNLGIMVMKGSVQNGILRFDTVSKLLQYPVRDNGILYENLYALSLDIPVIEDINGDGDLDVLAYAVYGSVVSYYENQSAEHGNSGAYALDSLPYKWVTSCWGDFIQNLSSNSISLNIDTPCNCQYTNDDDSVYSTCIGTLPPSVGGETRHQGNSLYTVIDPVYKSIDLLNGNVGYNDLMFLRNCAGRTDQFGFMCEWDSIFPSSPCSHPIDMYQYPAAYGINISNDSLEDILVSPNVIPPYIFSGGVARNVKNVLWYKNLNDTVCWYEYENDSFLVHHMLDFGSNSRGVFYDFNGDGLMDIVAGSYGYFNPDFLPSTYQSTLAVYQNIGTTTQPAYQELTLDYDSFSNYHLDALSPAFGDLDGDGKPDLLMGDAFGYLYFCKNMGTGGASSYPVITQQHFDTIKVTGYAAPFIYDVNGDSLNDLLLGADDGRIHYYQNIGTRTQPLFSRIATNDSFGRINTCAYGYRDGCFSQPFVMKDDSGNLILYVGSMSGVILKYKVNTADLSAPFELLDSDVIGRAIGTNTTVSISDINNDGKMEYLLGTSGGGLVMYSDSNLDPGTSLAIADVHTEPDRLEIFPNPARSNFTCRVAGGNFINPKVLLFDVLGKEIKTDARLGSNEALINADALSNGFYIVKLIDVGKSYLGKVIVQR